MPCYRCHRSYRCRNDFCGSKRKQRRRSGCLDPLREHPHKNAKTALVQLEKSATPRIGHRVINHHPADKVAKTLRQRFKKSVQAQCKLDKMELEDENKGVQSGFSVSLRFHCHGRYWMILTFFTSVCLKE